jgi:hypothetical protein
MKFESLILGSLFVACFTLCALVMGAMLLSTPASVKLTGTNHAQAVARTAPPHCVQSADEATCPRIDG